MIKEHNKRTLYQRNLLDERCVGEIFTKKTLNINEFLFVFTTDNNGVNDGTDAIDHKSLADYFSSNGGSRKNGEDYTTNNVTEFNNSNNRNFSSYFNDSSQQNGNGPPTGAGGDHASSLPQNLTRNGLDG